ncbi:cwf21 domain-containing protein [Lasiosphaeria hispida]|uniref:Cwf21 domain-containing protein n=1 Tax=Lasiosphaeria hispida TaxID=260671 RepID=A0AAJ0HN35_9PEZI|nr:cwf21 domain-containing protein [Lasiosphaeria hispida]
MSDNVGLSTPRGSGTSGYVQRNLAQMRPRDMGAPYAPRDVENLHHKPRVPDQGLLEHDRKREVEVKVFELRDKLEDEGVDEDEIEDQCSALRAKLLAEMNKKGGVGPQRNLKMHQVHELADAKIKESERLRQALKISKDYQEGSHWRRQEERVKKAAERDEGGGEMKSEHVREVTEGGGGGRDRDRDGGRERRRERSGSRDGRNRRDRRGRDDSRGRDGDRN